MKESNTCANCAKYKNGQCSLRGEQLPWDFCGRWQSK